MLWRASPAYADDEGSLAGQAAAAAHGQITADLNSFGGDSRFTTWAGKFVMYAVTAAAGRRCWHGRSWPDEHQHWDQLLTRVAAPVAGISEAHDFVRALRQAVEQDLTVKQRLVFTAIVFAGLPPEALTTGLGTSRNAIYQPLFEARRKLGARLAPGSPGAAGTRARWLKTFQNHYNPQFAVSETRTASNMPPAHCSACFAIMATWKKIGGQPPVREDSGLVPMPRAFRCRQ